jgi:hypothetical protein
MYDTLHTNTEISDKVKREPQTADGLLFSTHRCQLAGGRLTAASWGLD